MPAGHSHSGAQWQQLVASHRKSIVLGHIASLITHSHSQFAFFLYLVDEQLIAGLQMQASQSSPGTSSGRQVRWQPPPTLHSWDTWKSRYSWPIASHRSRMARFSRNAVTHSLQQLDFFDAQADDQPLPRLRDAET